MTTEQAVAAPPSTYRQLLRLPGFRDLLISSLLTRTASQMWTVGIVLFALQRYHSPSVAGVSLFLLIFPGLLLSPIAGALLDRHGRKLLMTLDFSVAALCLTVIVVLAAANLLPVWGLYVLLVGGSITSTLSVAGARSFFPLLVPRDLWDRGNAADSVLLWGREYRRSGARRWRSSRLSAMKPRWPAPRSDTSSARWCCRASASLLAAARSPAGSLLKHGAAFAMS